jgi:hypothetical protein
MLALDRLRRIIIALLMGLQVFRRVECEEHLASIQCQGIGGAVVEIIIDHRR